MLDVLKKFPVVDNLDGTYTIVGLVNDTYCVQVEKEGYFASNPKNVLIDGTDMTVDVVIKKYVDVPTYKIIVNVKNAAAEMLEQATVGVSDDCDGLPVYNEFYYIGLSGMTDEKRYKKTYLPINQDIADGTSCQVTIALNDTANEGSYTKLVYTDTLSGIIDPTQTGTFTFPAFADTTPGSGVVAFPLLIHVEDWVISEIEVIEGSTITVSDLAYLDMKFEVVTPDPIG